MAEKFRGERLKELKRVNILIAEHKIECFKELKRQKDEYLKKLRRPRSSGVRGVKEPKKVKKE